MADPYEQFSTVVASQEGDPYASFSRRSSSDSPVSELKPEMDWNAPNGEIRAAISALPSSMQQKARNEWAKRRVSKERTEAGGAQTAYDIGRNLIRGTPVGSWLDEGVAGVKSLFGGDYDENVALERARNDAADTSATKLGSLPLIGDVTTSGVTKLAGGLLSAPFTPALRVAQGVSMLPRVANALVTGAAYGGAYGAGEGEGADRVGNAALGGLIGGGIGAATPIVAQGVGNAVSGVRNRLTNPLTQYDRGAVSRVARAVEDDALLPRYQRAAQNLGPAGMLADMGENLRGQAGAIANSPGRGQARIVQALEGRREGATNRIEDAINETLGLPVNVPRTVEQLRREANARARPHYQQFHATTIEPTERLLDLLTRANGAGAYNKARQLMIAEGIDPRRPENDGLLMDYIKRAVDDLAGGAEPGSNLQRVYGNLARDIREEVDSILSPGAPERSVWAMARREAGEGLQFREAAEQGQGAFRKSLTPDQMDVDLERMNPLQQEAYRVGARDSARTMMGNAGTAWGPNGDTAARRVLQTEFGAEKVRRIAQNPADADRLANRLQTETRFAETEQEVLRNSVTARRQAAQNEFPSRVAAGETAAQIGSRSLSGVAVESAYRIANLLTAGALNERRARIADHAARMLIAQGVSRDNIAAGLQQYIQRRRLSGEQAARISQFIDRLGRGVAVGAAGGVSRQPLEVTVYPQGDPRN